jgi:hypothetical protein
MTEQEISDFLYKFLDRSENPNSVYDSNEPETTEVTFSLGETIISCKISLN